MAFTLNVTSPMSGKIVSLTNADVDNWNDVIPLFHSDGTECYIAFEYDNSMHAGVISLNDAGDALDIVFTEQVIVPGGVCITVDCGCVGCDDHDSEVVSECHNNNIDHVSGSTRLTVSDNNGCPVGYVTLSQVLEFIESNLEIPETLCDLFNDGIQHSTGIIASDRVLIVGDDNCSVSSVSIDDAINCNGN